MFFQGQNQDVQGVPNKVASEYIIYIYIYE